MGAPIGSRGGGVVGGRDRSVPNAVAAMEDEEMGNAVRVAESVADCV